MTEHKPVTVITLADVLCYVRNQLITAIEQRDEPKINALYSILEIIEDAVKIHCPPGWSCFPMFALVEYMTEAIQDYFHGETWKSTIPTVEEIQTAFRGNVSEPLE